MELVVAVGDFERGFAVDCFEVAEEDSEDWILVAVEHFLAVEAEVKVATVVGSFDYFKQVVAAVV